MSKPITFCWTDSGYMQPLGVGMAKRADEEFTVGEQYRLVEVEERSHATHAHFFSVLHELWQSLPEKYREESWGETEEHLRRYALIKTGFHRLEEFPCNTKAEAYRWAARLKPMDEYSIVIVEGNVVRRYTAKSQSYRAMPGKGEFQRSKSAVLGFVADLLELPKNAEQRETQ